MFGVQMVPASSVVGGAMNGRKQGRPIAGQHMTRFGAKQARDGGTSAGRVGIAVGRFSGLGLVALLPFVAAPTVAVAGHAQPIPGELDGDGIPVARFDEPELHKWTAPTSEMGRYLRITAEIEHFDENRGRHEAGRIGGRYA